MTTINQSAPIQGKPKHFWARATTKGKDIIKTSFMTFALGTGILFNPFTSFLQAEEKSQKTIQEIQNKEWLFKSDFEKLAKATIKPLTEGIYQQLLKEPFVEYSLKDIIDSKQRNSSAGEYADEKIDTVIETLAQQMMQFLSEDKKKATFLSEEDIQEIIVDNHYDEIEEKLQQIFRQKLVLIKSEIGKPLNDENFIKYQAKLVVNLWAQRRWQRDIGHSMKEIKAFAQKNDYKGIKDLLLENLLDLNEKMVKQKVLFNIGRWDPSKKEFSEKELAALKKVTPEITQGLTSLKEAFINDFIKKIKNDG